MSREKWFEIRLKDDEANQQLEAAAIQIKALRTDMDEKFEAKRKKLTQGDDLAPAVLKIVKVYWQSNVAFSLVIKWQVDTETKVLFQPLFLSKICHIWKMVRG